MQQNPPKRLNPKYFPVAAGNISLRKVNSIWL